MKYSLKKFLFAGLYIYIFACFLIVAPKGFTYASTESKPSQKVVNNKNNKSTDNVKQTTKTQNTTKEESENQNKENHPKGKLLATYSDINDNSVEVRIKDIEKIIFLVKNNTSINLSEITEEFFKLEDSIQREIVMTYVLQQNALAEAERSNIQNSDEFKNRMEYARQGMLVEMYLQKKIKNHPELEIIVDQVYKDYIENTKNLSEFKFQVVKFSDQKSAEDLYNKLSKKPESFVELVKSSKSVGSYELENGYIEELSIEKEIKNKISTMNLNSISKPFQNISKEWLIIKLLDKRPMQIQSKESLMPRLNPQIQGIILEKIHTTWLQKTKLDLLI